MLFALLWYNNRVFRGYQRLQAAIVHTIAPACLTACMLCFFFCCNRASLSDQLKVEELWVPFRKIACERLPAALPDFFKASHTTCTTTHATWHLLVFRVFVFLATLYQVQSSFDRSELLFYPAASRSWPKPDMLYV